MSLREMVINVDFILTFQYVNFCIVVALVTHDTLHQLISAKLITNNLRNFMVYCIYYYSFIRLLDISILLFLSSLETYTGSSSISPFTTGIQLTHNKWEVSGFLGGDSAVMSEMKDPVPEVYLSRALHSFYTS